ncbi:hypothetical protein [Streptomyces sp. NPDC059076]|uniref:hypothetical protein n=1 Tax=unclassified Streptomyces TaxID=2593676 RepID=UPI003678B21A
MRYFRESMQNNMSLCQYNVRAFTNTEIDALEEYDDKLPLREPFEPNALLKGGTDPVSTMREHAKALAHWHKALQDLLTDARLEPPAYHNPYTTSAGPPPEYDPYSPAVTRFLRSAAEDYHSYRHGFEYAVTVWALGLQAPGGYPAETRHLDLRKKRLKLW